MVVKAIAGALALLALFVAPSAVVAVADPGDEVGECTAQIPSVFFFVAQNVWITTECNEAIGHNCASPDHHLVGVEYWSLPEVEGAMPVQCAGDSLPPYPDDDDPTYDTPPPVGTAWDTNPNPSDTYTDGFPNEGDWSSSLWMDDFDLTPSSLQGINDNDGSSDANDGAANNWSLDSSQSSTHYDMGSSADGSWVDDWTHVSTTTSGGFVAFDDSDENHDGNDASSPFL